MCDKCKELKEIFQNALGICERQTAFNEYDKQRKKCAKEFGSLKGPEKKAEITVEKKKSKKKKSSNEEAVGDKEESEKPIVHKSTMKPENKKSAKEVEDALNQSNKAKPKDDSKKPTSQEPAGKPKTQCKYYYRGGLCANSLMDKPFCNHPDDQDKCTFKK